MTEDATSSPPFLAILNCRILIAYQPHMKQKEACNYNTEDAGENISCNDKELQTIRQPFTLQHHIHDAMRRYRNHIARDRRIKQHTHEKLIIVETNTISNPWTVMVHF